MAEIRSEGGSHLERELDLLVRAAKKARERGLPADAELANWLERAMLSRLAGGKDGEPGPTEALAIARVLAVEGAAG
jgi:hypothetical protein